MVKKTGLRNFKNRPTTIPKEIIDKIVGKGCGPIKADTRPKRPTINIVFF